MTFSLSGLLRVRSAQERVAAEELSRTTAERIGAERAEKDAEASLADIADEVGDAATLLAMAAARAAGRSLLMDLQALTALRRGEEDAARSLHLEARRELKGLERLEAAERARRISAGLHAEQTALDEIAVERAARKTGSAA